MSDPVLDRAADLLAAAEHRTLPLGRLHAALVADLGRGVGGEERLRARLARHPLRFAVLPGVALGWEDERWPVAEREAYRRALGEAGHESGPHAVLLELPAATAADPWPDTLSGSVGELLSLVRDDALLEASAYFQSLPVALAG